MLHDLQRAEKVITSIAWPKGGLAKVSLPKLKPSHQQ